MSSFVEMVLSGGDYRLAIDTPNSNWSIYMNEKGQAISKANKGGCDSSFYGDKHHVKNLMVQGFFNDYSNFTDYGLSIMSGLHSKIFNLGSENQFSKIQF